MTAKPNATKLETLIREANIDGAKAAIDEMLAKNANDVDALAGRARVMAAEGDVKGALAVLDGALKIDGSHADALTYKGALLLDDRTKDDEAAALFKKALQSNPKHAAANFNHGRLLARRGDFPAAITAIDKALANDPDNAFYLFARARLDVDVGDVEKSFARLVQTVKLNPTIVEAWVILAQLQMQRGAHQDAKKNLETALSHNKNALALLDAHASAALATGDIPGAIRSARAVVDAMPQNGGAKVNLAICMMAQDKHDEAETLLRQALKHDAKDPRALHTLGMLLEQTDDDDAIDEARFLYEEAVNIAPDFWKASSDLGLLHVVNERHLDLARGHALLSKALASSGGRPEPLFNLALCEAKQGKNESALTRLQKLAAHPASSDGMKEQALSLVAAINDG